MLLKTYSKTKLTKSPDVFGIKSLKTPPKTKCILI